MSRTVILIELADLWALGKREGTEFVLKLATAQDLLQPVTESEDDCAILAFGLSHCVTSRGGYQNGETSKY